MKMGESFSTYEDVLFGPNESQRALGWHSIMNNELVVGNVVAKTCVTALAIDRDSFKDLVGQYDDLIQRATHKRQLQGIAIFCNSQLDDEQVSALLNLMTKKTFLWGKTFYREGNKILQHCVLSKRARWKSSRREVDTTKPSKRGVILAKTNCWRTKIRTTIKATKGHW